jgi:D-lactate dehydrogenase
VIEDEAELYYNDQAVRDMVENSLRSCVAFMQGDDNPWEV